MPEQEIGRRFRIKPENLPAPKATTVASSRSFAIPYAGQTPRVPDGFKINLFAGGLWHPQRLLVLPNGDAIVAEQRMGYLTLFVTGMETAAPNGSSEPRSRWLATALFGAPSRAASLPPSYTT